MALSTTRPLVSTGRMLCTAVDRAGCSTVAIGRAGPEAKVDGSPKPGRAVKEGSSGRSVSPVTIFTPVRGEAAGQGGERKMGVQALPGHRFWGKTASFLCPEGESTTTPTLFAGERCCLWCKGKLMTEWRSEPQRPVWIHRK